MNKEKTKLYISWAIILFLLVFILGLILINNQLEDERDFCAEYFNEFSWKVYHNPCEVYGTCNESYFSNFKSSWYNKSTMYDCSKENNHYSNSTLMLESNISLFSSMDINICEEKNITHWKKDNDTYCFGDAGSNSCLSKSIAICMKEEYYIELNKILKELTQ